MKSTFLHLFIILLPLSSLMAQAPKKSLVQEWTNASCGPCASQNPAFDTRLNTYTNKVVTQKIQVRFPGFDPMHNEYKSVLDYYTDSVYVDGGGNSVIDGVPTVMVNGISNYAPSAVTTTVLGALATTSPISVDISHQVDANGDSITIYAKFKNVSTNNITGDLRAFIALQENNISYATAPGTNGEKAFHHVLRSFITNKTGNKYTTLNAGDSIELNYRITVPSYIADYRQIEVIAYLQNWETKFVYNANNSVPRPNDVTLPDIAMTSKSIVANTGLCDYDFDIKLFIKNVGTQVINNFDVDYLVNGVKRGTIQYVRTFSPGDTVVSEFKGAPLSAGRATITYQISNINNGGRDVYRLNNTVASNIMTTVSQSSVPVMPFAQDFESATLGGLPTNFVNTSAYTSAFRVLNSQGVGLGQNELGAYGLSDRALGINFYTWSTSTYGQIGRLILPRLIVATSSNMKLVYDRAHARYSDATNPTPTDDRLRFEYSTNCGQTWTSIIEKDGAMLETNASQEAAYIPSPSDWKTDTINLSSLPTGEVLFSITGVSDFGNYLWLDNIRFISTTGTQNVNPFDGTINLYPNPITNALNLEISPTKAEVMSVFVQDITGKTIETIVNNQLFATGKHTIVWNPTVSTGIYLIKIKSESGEKVQKVSVIR